MVTLNFRKYSTVFAPLLLLASRSEGDIQPDEDTTRKRTKEDNLTSTFSWDTF